MSGGHADAEREAAPERINVITGLWRDDPARAFLATWPTNGSVAYIRADLAPAAPEPDPMGALAVLFRDLLRFADAAAGEELTIEGAPSPQEVLWAYSGATGDEEVETYADRLPAMLAPAAPAPAMSAREAARVLLAAMPNEAEPGPWRKAANCAAFIAMTPGARQGMALTHEVMREYLAALAEDAPAREGEQP